MVSFVVAPKRSNKLITTLGGSFPCASSSNFTCERSRRIESFAAGSGFPLVSSDFLVVVLVVLKMCLATQFNGDRGIKRPEADFIDPGTRDSDNCITVFRYEDEEEQQQLKGSRQTDTRTE